MQGDECQAGIMTAQNDIAKYKSTIHGLDIEINNYERGNGYLIDEQKHKLAKNSAEYNMAHDLTANLQGLEAKFYSMEVEERSKNTDLEAVNYSNQALMDRNLDLKSEYEALQKHSLLLNQQNKDLQRELDTFVETDDVVRRNLDRKVKVDEIRYKMDAAMRTSHEMLTRHSPVRGGSPTRVTVTETRGPSPFGAGRTVTHSSTTYGGPGPLPPNHMPLRPTSINHRDYSPAGQKK